MALSDIPEFVEAHAGDLIRADNWNTVQRQLRDSLRKHQHTRAPGAAINDAATTDEADQISTNELADGSVTAAKLAPGAITAVSIPDGSITATKLADGAVVNSKLAGNSVGTANIQANAVNSNKLAFTQIASNSLILSPTGPTQFVDVVVQTGLPITKTTSIYFPLVALVGATGTGLATVSAEMVQRQAVGANTFDLFIRLRNTGTATANLFWQVMTFAA